MRRALWPKLTAEEDKQELAATLSGKPDSTMPLSILVAEIGDGDLVGFLEVGLRSHADGCDARIPVGFVEGWFVSERHRRKGIGAKLLAAAEDWARSHGCIEMASDTWLDHDTSQFAHEALAFEVVDRCVHYRKALSTWLPPFARKCEGWVHFELEGEEAVEKRPITPERLPQIFRGNIVTTVPLFFQLRTFG